MIFWTWYAMITAMVLHVYEMYVGIHLCGNQISDAPRHRRDVVQPNSLFDFHTMRDLCESLSITWTMTCVAGTRRSCATKSPIAAPSAIN